MKNIYGFKKQNIEIQASEKTMFGPNMTRRQVLRAGAATAIIAPFMNMQRTEAQGVEDKKLVLFTHANGTHHSWSKMEALRSGSPDIATGTNFQLTDTLELLEPIRNDVVILKNLELKRRGVGNPHYSGGLNMLTGRAPVVSGVAPGGTTSLDQAVAATQVGQVPFPTVSLQVGPNSAGKGGVLYSNGKEVKAQEDPVTAYKQLVARIDDGTGTGQVDAHLLDKKSVLDFVKDDIRNVQNQLGMIERSRLDQVFEGLRQMELSLGAVIDAQSCVKPEEITVSQGETFHRISQAHIDIAAFALSCGLTRVVTLCWGGKEAGWALPVANVGSWHSQSHYDSYYNSDHAAMFRCEQYLVGQYAQLVEKIRNISSGSGSLLDSSVAMFATTNGETRGHTGPNTPFFLAGSWGGEWQSGRVIDCQAQLHGQLLLTLAQGMGLQVDTYGDADYCPGRLQGLS